MMIKTPQTTSIHFFILIVWAKPTERTLFKICFYSLLLLTLSPFVLPAGYLVKASFFTHYTKYSFELPINDLGDYEIKWNQKVSTSPVKGSREEGFYFSFNKSGVYHLVGNVESPYEELFYFRNTNKELVKLKIYSTRSIDRREQTQQ